MFWKTPHIIKIYEALGAIGDQRIEVTENSARVYSSSRGKYYEVLYDSKNHAIMCNDNASYYNETLGYPAIAFLIGIGVLEKNENFANTLKDIPWKDINQKNNNDYEKTLDEIHEKLEKDGVDTKALKNYVSYVMKQIKDVPFHLYGEKVKPPDGY